MGFADENHGVYLFNDMASPEEVKELVDFSTGAINTGRTDLSETLQTRLEKRFNPRAFEEIPWR